MVDVGRQPAVAGNSAAEAERIASELGRLYQAGAIQSVGDAVAHAQAVARAETCSRLPETVGALVPGNELARAIREALARSEAEQAIDRIRPSAVHTASVYSAGGNLTGLRYRNLLYQPLEGRRTFSVRGRDPVDVDRGRGWQDHPSRPQR